jgi:hypothetical protein
VVESLTVTLPAAGLPVIGEADLTDPVLAAAWRAITSKARRPPERRGWSWITAKLSEPQIRALRDYIDGLPAADTITVRVAREDVVSRLGSALAALSR